MSIKYLNAQHIIVDSSDRVSGTDNNFVADLTGQLDLTKDFDRVAPISVAMKRSFHLIENGFNTFILTESGFPPVTITFPYGAWGATVFMNTLVPLLNSASPNGWTYTMSLSNTLGLYTYTCSGGNPSFTFNTNDMYPVMGFEPNSTNTFSSKTLVSVNMLDFQKDIIYIHSDLVGEGKDNVLVFMTANGNDFSTIRYQCQDVEASSKVVKNKKNQYSFSVLDADEDPIPLTLPVVIELIIYKANDSLDRFLIKMEDLLQIVKYKLLK